MGNPVSSTNKADSHDIAKIKILLKVVLNTITIILFAWFIHRRNIVEF